MPTSNAVWSQSEWWSRHHWRSRSLRATSSTWRLAFPSVNSFAMRRLPYRRSAPFTSIYALFDLRARADTIIFSTIPCIVALGCFAKRAASRLRSTIRADLAMRGFAISSVTLTRVALADSRLLFLRRMPRSWCEDAGAAVPFSTLFPLRALRGQNMVRARRPQ